MQRLPNLLRRAYLGGVIDECVLSIAEDNFAYIQAVDPTNTIFVDVATELPLLTLGKLGLGNLGLLCKFFDATKDAPFTLRVEGNRLTVEAQPHGRLNYLLTQADLIPTIVEDPDSMTKLLNTCVNKTGLVEARAKDILQYLSLLKLAAVTLTVDAQTVTISGGRTTEHQFTMPLGATIGAVTTPYGINVYADKLAAVLNVLDYDTEGVVPLLHLAPDRPLLIEQNADNLWALVPVNVE